MDFDYDLREFGGVCRLFPLPDLVCFPHALLPLHIFEPRYRQMTEDALAGDQFITMVQIRPAAEGSPWAEPVPDRQGRLPGPDRAARTIGPTAGSIFCCMGAAGCTSSDRFPPRSSTRFGRRNS